MERDSTCVNARWDKELARQFAREKTSVQAGKSWSLLRAVLGRISAPK
jgi:hypothetical protein